MVIVQLAGGLGNQLQQYALYRKYLALGREAKLDPTWFSDARIQNKVAAPRSLELEYFPGLPMNFCSREEAIRFKGTDGVFGRARRFLQRHGVPVGQKREIFQETGMYHPEVLDLWDGYVMGFFAAEKYYADILPKLREDIHFPKSESKAVRSSNENLMKQIQEEAAQGITAVSIHLRRGDYLDAGNAQLLGGISTPAYYEGAVKYVQENAGARTGDEAVGGNAGMPTGSAKLHFYLFSDDPAYAKTLHFGAAEDENTVVDWNTGRDSLLDMQLMSKCQVNICANSTFSFWGARLNASPDKIMVRPSIHKNTQEFDAELMHDLWKGWVLVDPQGQVR